MQTNKNKMFLASYLFPEHTPYFLLKQFKAQVLVRYFSYKQNITNL